MERSLGKLFAGLLIFNTVRILLPYPTENGNQWTLSESWFYINLWLSGPDANGPDGSSENQYNMYAVPYTAGYNESMGQPGFGGYPLNSAVVYVAGIVGPSVLVYKKGGNFLTIFGIGVVGWAISKMLQACEMKPHGDISYYNWGTRPEDYNSYVRLMKYWQEVFEVTAWGTMAAAFVARRNAVPLVDNLVAKVL